MTVKELQEELARYPDEMTVCVLVADFRNECCERETAWDLTVETEADGRQVLLIQ